MSFNNADNEMIDSIFAVRRELEKEQHDDYAEREQFIGTLVGKEEFLIPISVVSEIIMFRPITYVPESPKFVEGVINLRGRILPAVNLRKIFGCSRELPSPAPRLIITCLNGIYAGMLVDSITTVVYLHPTEIENESLLINDSNIEVIERIAKRDQRVNGIINVQKIYQSIVGQNVKLETLLEQ